MAETVGRPTKYKDEYADQAEKLCRILGASDIQLCFFFNIDYCTLIDWIESKEDFANSIRKGVNEREAYLYGVEQEKKKRSEYRRQPEMKKRANEYTKNRVKTDIHTRIRFNVSSLIRSRIKNNNVYGVFRHLGYSTDDLIKHLEKQFKEGMTLENYGKVWHIDHIKPDSWFNYTSKEDEEFKKCWALENLQPLFVKDNLKKGNRYAG